MKKKLVMFTSVFASLAILSTGFAAWVITGGDTNEDQFGNFVVDTVDDKRHAIKVENADTENEGLIIFGRPKTMSTTNAWLKNEGGETEKLSTSFKVTVTNAENSAIADILTATLALTDTNKYYESAVTAKYVSTFPTPAFYSDAALENATTTFDKNGTVYVGVTFAWGTHFGEKNPYEFYNQEGITASSTLVLEDNSTTTYGDDAYKALNALSKLSESDSNIKFNLKLSTK